MLLDRRQAVGGFVGGDFVGVGEGHGDVVQAVQQRVAAEAVDVEAEDQRMLVVFDRAGLKVHGQFAAGVPFGPLEQLLDRLFVQLDRQHAVLEAVVVEDVGEAGGDDRLEPVIGQRPDGMFAAAAAAEIAPRDQDRGPLYVRPVELEVRVGRPVVVKPPVEKQKLAEPRPLDPLQELLGNDLIGIHIRPVHRRHDAGVLRERLHRRRNPIDEGY